ncbi:MAG: adenosylmethionine--8-amino-7-oxononanoate transaminase [Blastomonas sp.]
MMPAIWHPFTQHGLGEPIPRIVRGEGACLLTDDGRRILDGISSWWVNTHGHCHPRIMAAIREQSEKLDQMIFAGWTHEPAERLAGELGEFLPGELSHIFFSDSGSTAVEVALKMALGLWHNRGHPRHRIIVMQHSYHGDTFGGMSVGERGAFNRAYERLLFDVAPIPFPGEGDTLGALEALLANRADPPAALIVEPLVLGAGGMKMYAPELIAGMAALCRAHGVPFILDEVMTGWGRTGSCFAFEQAEIVPDIVCLSKGITGGAVPLAVTACTRPFFDAHYSADKADMFFHSSSYTANPIACAAACANLSIWRDEPVMERIGHIAARHAGFRETAASLGALRNLRQCGTILAMELEAGGGGQDYLSGHGPALQRFFMDRDLLLRPLGNCIYVMPPYCVSDADLDKIYQAIADAADAFG